MTTSDHGGSAPDGAARPKERSGGRPPPARKAATDGAGDVSGYGNVVWMDHGGDVLTVYAHLARILVRAGDVVEGRAVIGLSGHRSSGR
jgi:hypothetical protein